MAAVVDELAGTKPSDLPAGEVTLLDRLFVLAVIACTLISGIVLAGGIHGHTVMPAVDLTLDTVSVVVFIALTTLAWARF